jgi:hypothetical protein
VPRGGRERRLQKALVRWKDPENRKLVLEALHDAEREDLVEPFLRALRQSTRGGARPGRGAPRKSAGAEGGEGGGEVDLDTCG